MAQRYGYPGRKKMIDRLVEEAWEQWYRESGSEHKANYESQSYMWRLQVTSLSNLKKEFCAVMQNGLPIEPLRDKHLDPVA